MKNLKLTALILAGLIGFMSCGTKEEQQASSFAQRSVKVWGNCEQCKETIEKAGKMEGVSSVDWNEESKQMLVKYDSTSVSVDAILKSVALAGYDNELYTADNTAYKELPECCQYERK